MEKSEHICTKTDYEHFDEALEWHKVGRHGSKRAAFSWMIDCYYSTTVVEDDVPTRKLLPSSERPTLEQFYAYAMENLPWYLRV